MAARATAAGGIELGTGTSGMVVGGMKIVGVAAGSLTHGWTVASELTVLVLVYNHTV